jgi:hypothetical protein
VAPVVAAAVVGAVALALALVAVAAVPAEGRAGVVAGRAVDVRVVVRAAATVAGIAVAETPRRVTAVPT